MRPYTKNITEAIKASLDLKTALLNNEVLLSSIDRTIEMIIDAYQRGHKVLLCGNGGSAADAQHIAAELTGRFYVDRPPLNAEALHTDTSYLTAVSNDMGYEHVYSRMIAAKGVSDDILIAISTSGNSPNIIAAAQQAHSQGLKVIALTGLTGGSLSTHADIHIGIPSTDTPRIQECHILIGHIICEQVEKILF